MNAVAGTFTFSRNPQAGRVIDNSSLYAVGQQADATTLEQVKLMGSTDKAALQTEKDLAKLDRYVKDLAVYDNFVDPYSKRKPDLNDEPGKIAVAGATVHGEIDCWVYSATGVLELGPDQKPASMDLEVQNSTPEHLTMRTLPGGVRELRIVEENEIRKDVATYLLDDAKGTISSTFEPGLWKLK